MDLGLGSASPFRQISIVTEKFGLLKKTCAFSISDPMTCHQNRQSWRQKKLTRTRPDKGPRIRFNVVLLGLTNAITQPPKNEYGRLARPQNRSKEKGHRYKAKLHQIMPSHMQKTVLRPLFIIDVEEQHETWQYGKEALVVVSMSVLQNMSALKWWLKIWGDYCFPYFGARVGGNYKWQVNTFVIVMNGTALHKEL